MVTSLSIGIYTTHANLNFGFSPQILTGQNLVNPMMDSALRRGPLLRLKNGELKAAVGRFRHLLQAVEA